MNEVAKNGGGELTEAERLEAAKAALAKAAADQKARREAKKPEPNPEMKRKIDALVKRSEAVHKSLNGRRWKEQTKEEFPKEEPKAAEPKAKDADERPLIELGPKDSPRLINVVATAMKHLTDADAKIFQRGGMLMRPVLEPSFDSEGKPVKVASLIQLDEGALQLVLMQHLRWARRTADGNKSVNPVDTEVAPLILKARGAWPFRPVSGLLTAPTLRPDGSPLIDEGYDKATGLLLFNSMPIPVNPKPSVTDAEAALELLKGLFVEVPFSDFNSSEMSPSRSVALSLPISLAALGALETVPLHGYTAHSIGSGKTYLVNIASLIISGRKCAVIGATRSPEELEKKLGTSMMAGRQLISLDNYNGVLASDLLSQALTEPVITLRPLGRSTEVQITSRSVFAATGNNLEIADDLARRVLMCSLDAKRECAWDREFKLEPLEMIAKDRARYIAAALTIPLAYIAAGMPDCPRDLNGFKQWSRLVRGSLMWLGEADPVETMKTVIEGDPKLQAATSMLFAMRAAFGDRAHTSAELVDLVDEKKRVLGYAYGCPAEAKGTPRRDGGSVQGRENFDGQSQLLAAGAKRPNHFRAAVVW
jgi:putative DNA primase/helicase